MKTAVIVTGMCRNTLLTKDTWNILPFSADWYLTTWDVTKQTYNNEFIASKFEIEKIKDKFKEIIVTPYHPYFETFIKTYKFNYVMNPYYLLGFIRNSVLEKDYDRFIITRSDLYLHKLRELTDADFYVDKNNAKIYLENLYRKPLPSSDYQRLAMRSVKQIHSCPTRRRASTRLGNCRFPQTDRKSTRLNSSHIPLSRMPSSA